MNSEYCVSYHGIKILMSFDSESLAQLFFESNTPFVDYMQIINEIDLSEFSLSLKIRHGNNISIPIETEKVLLHKRGDERLFGAKWREEQTVYIYNPHHPAIIIDKGNQIEIIYQNAGIDAYINLHIVLFPLWYRLLGCSGMLSYHASAVSNGENAIAFCGEKGAGKTSCILDLILRSGYTFISNDYLMIKVGSKGVNDIVEVVGTPEAIRIGHGTYNCYKEELEDYFDASQIAEKRQIYLRDFKRRYSITPSAKLKCVFIVSLKGEGIKNPVKIDSEEAIRIMNENSLQKTGFHTPEFLKLSLELTPMDLDLCIRELCHMVPFYRLDLPMNFSMYGLQKILQETFISAMNSTYEEKTL